MYRRVKRERFDTVLDAIVSAATGTGAPMTHDPTGQDLKVICASGGQLTELDKRLRQFIGEDTRIGESAIVLELLDELQLCSGLYIVSTTEEVILASNRSSDEFSLIAELDLDLMPDYDAFKAGSARFRKGLLRLPGEAKRNNG